MHINYQRGETREFVYRRRAIGYGWYRPRTIFNRESCYNKSYRAKVKQALREAERDDSWDDFVCPILGEAEDPWRWD